MPETRNKLKKIFQRQATGNSGQSETPQLVPGQYGPRQYPHHPHRSSRPSENRPPPPRRDSSLDKADEGAVEEPGNTPASDQIPEQVSGAPDTRGRRSRRDSGLSGASTEGRRRRRRRFVDKDRCYGVVNFDENGKILHCVEPDCDGLVFYIKRSPGCFQEANECFPRRRYSLYIDDFEFVKIKTLKGGTVTSEKDVWECPYLCGEVSIYCIKDHKRCSRHHRRHKAVDHAERLDQIGSASKDDVALAEEMAAEDAEQTEGESEGEAEVISSASNPELRMVLSRYVQETREVDVVGGEEGGGSEEEEAAEGG